MKKSALLYLLLLLLAGACRTGKGGCNCPTFGENRVSVPPAPQAEKL
jgi:hypothetical protein